MTNPKQNNHSVWDGKPLMYVHSKYWEDTEQGKDWLRVRRKKLCECKLCQDTDMREHSG